MKKKILALTIAPVLGISSLAFNSFAEEVNNQVKQERQMGERPEKPENEIFGKITAISENSVTISLAEMKKPEEGQKDFKDFQKEKDFDKEKRDGKNNQSRNRPEERKELTEEQKAEMKKKMEEMFTLTGETKTINISKADFNAFGRGPRDGKAKGDDANADTNNNVNNNQRTVKTYKDYQVGDYISIELESKESNTAKTVRDAFMMRGGMKPRGNKQGNSANNATTTN